MRAAEAGRGAHYRIEAQHHCLLNAEVRIWIAASGLLRLGGALSCEMIG